MMTLRKHTCNFVAKVSIILIIIVSISFWHLRKKTNPENSGEPLNKFTTNLPAPVSYKRGNDKYLDIGTLQALVEKDSAHGPVIISEFNINNFLSGVEKDNDRWNITALTANQIKDITNEEGRYT